MSKNGRAAALIARELFDWPLGTQIPRVSDYVRRFGVGNGTVQGAIQLLTEMGAIQVEPRGQFGTFLTGANRALARSLAGLGPLVGSMPLPYSRRYEGLATAIYEIASRSGLNLSLTYMRGGATRLGALMRGQIDFTVLSALALDVEAEHADDLAVISLLPKGTYVGDHAILLADPEAPGITDGMAVGVDPSSIDQVELTRAESQDRRVTLVEAPYTILMERLLLREIDAVIWNADEVQVRHPGIAIRPLQSEKSRRLSRRHTCAAVVARKDRAGVVEMLQAVLDPAALAAVQAEVLAGTRLPSY